MGHALSLSRLDTESEMRCSPRPKSAALYPAGIDWPRALSALLLGEPGIKAGQELVDYPSPHGGQEHTQAGDHSGEGPTRRPELEQHRYLSFLEQWHRGPSLAHAEVLCLKAPSPLKRWQMPTFAFAGPLIRRGCKLCQLH